MPQGPKINKQTKKTEEIGNTVRQETMKNGFPIKKIKLKITFFPLKFSNCVFLP